MQWRKFHGVIKKAKESCNKSGYEISNHFVDAAKKVQIGSGAEREIKDIMLTRYACYLIALAVRGTYGPQMDADARRCGGLVSGGWLLGGVFLHICKIDRIHIVYGCETVCSVGVLCLFFFRHRFTQILSC